MAMNAGTAAVAGRRRHRRRPVMAEINVTPMVDVMLVLLIIFMVSAPLLTVGVPLDLPQTRAKSLNQDKEPLTVSRAIAIAGGTGPSTKKDKVRILRQMPGSTQKQEIIVNLSAIEKNKAEDVALLPNDVIDVPVSGTKSILRSLLGSVVPTVSQLPVRVIP